MLPKIKEKFFNKIKNSKFDVIINEIFEEKISFTDDELQYIKASETLGIGLRILKDGKIAYGNTTDPEQIDKLIDDTLTLTKWGERVSFDFPEKSDYPNLNLKAKVKYPSKKLVKMGEDFIKRIKELKNEYKVSSHFYQITAKTNIFNSNGFDGKYEKDLSAILLMVSLAREGDVFSHYSYVSKKEFPLEFFDEFYKSMKMITERLDKFEKIKSGIYKVVFTPAMFLHISEAFLQGINGDNIVKKVSPLNGKIGQKVLDEKLTIEDRGADENLTGSVPFDDEGVPVSNKLIFEKGVLKNYIFDLETASEYGTKSTGNGKRSYKEIARPGVHNFYIHPGNESIWKIVEKIDKGIWIESVVGGWTSNLLAGEYSATLLLAFYIENGEIKGRIKNAAITCNLYDVFNKVVGISKENQEIMNGVYPYIVVDGVNIALK